MKQHGLYKYVCDGQIIYIGKSNSDVSKRIQNHKNEPRFANYLLKGVEIYTCSLPNSTETDLLEKALINQYKPVLNVTDNQPGFSTYIDIKEPDWKLFNESEQEAKNPNKKKNIKQPFPSELLDIPYFAIEHDVVVIAPNGRVNIPGYKPVPKESLKYGRERYPIFFIAFRDPISYADKKCEYDPRQVWDTLINLCEQVLFRDYNFGDSYPVMPFSKKSAGLLEDLYFSAIGVQIPGNISIGINISKGMSCSTSSGMIYCYIDKLSLLRVYMIIMQATTPDKYDWLCHNEGFILRQIKRHVK